MVFGEITTTAKVDYEKIVRQTCKNIGFTSADVGLDADKCKVSPPPNLLYAIYTSHYLKTRLMVLFVAGVGAHRGAVARYWPGCPWTGHKDPRGDWCW